jgi:hypothetical protein
VSPRRGFYLILRPEDRPLGAPDASHVSSDAVFIEITDEGFGFNPYLVANPLSEHNLRGQPRWGLLLIRIYMSWVRFNKRGKRVLLCKHRSVTTE